MKQITLNRAEAISLALYCSQEKISAALITENFLLHIEETPSALAPIHKVGLVEFKNGTGWDFENPIYVEDITDYKSI